MITSFIPKNPGTCYKIPGYITRARDGIRTRDPRLGKAILHH